jgi:hypothetical protein
MLVPLILGNVRNFESGAAARRFARGTAGGVDEEQSCSRVSARCGRSA